MSPKLRWIVILAAAVILRHAQSHDVTVPAPTKDEGANATHKLEHAQGQNYSFPYPSEVQVASNITLDLSYVDCYFVMAASVNSLYEAEAACRSKGGSRVAHFRSASHFHSVISQIDWDSVPGFELNDGWTGQLWTGIHRESEEESFKWIDYSDINMENYEDAKRSDDEETLSSGNVANCLLARREGLVKTECEVNLTAGVFCHATTYDSQIPITLPSVVDEHNFCRVFLLPSTPAPKTIVSIPGYVRKTFFTVEGQFTWEEARRACDLVPDLIPGGLNTSLAVISSITEYQILRSAPNFLSFESNGYWIGLRRHPGGLKSCMDYDGIGAAFLWMDGTPLNYFAFIPYRPARYSVNEKCVAIAKSEYGSTGFNDYRCLVANEKGEIPDWIDDDDQCFGALCQYGIEWL